MTILYGVRIHMCFDVAAARQIFLAWTGAQKAGTCRLEGDGWLDLAVLTCSGTADARDADGHASPRRCDTRVRRRR